MEIVLAIIFGTILFLISYFSEELEIRNPVSKSQAKSFAGGIAITYIFMELIPTSIPQKNGEAFFFFILLGFSTFHLLEKYIYKHAEGKKLKEELREEHALLFAGYHILFGVLLMFFLREQLVTGILLFIPAVLMSLLSSASLRHMYEPLRTKKIIKILAALTPLIGIFIGYYLPLNLVIYQILAGIIAGSLIHLVVRDIIPKTRQGYSFFFAMGVIAMLGFLSITLVA